MSAVKPAKNHPWGWVKSQPKPKPKPKPSGKVK